MLGPQDIHRNHSFREGVDETGLLAYVSDKLMKIESIH